MSDREQLRAEGQIEAGDAENERIVGRAPTSEELFYVEWGDELAKDTLPFVNHVLRQFVTLSTALLGGAIAFYDKEVMNRGFKVAAMVLLLISLASATWGVLPYPYKGTLPRRWPYQLREAIGKGLSIKTACLWVSAGALLLSLFLLLVGIIAKNS